jgi:putative oxidoreductase
MLNNRPGAWNILLLLIRLWLAYVMIKNGNSVLDILSSADERQFFKKWFGEELHFPFPIVMAFLAKGSEFMGGILLALGLFTRAAASIVAFTMLVATLTANLGENFNIDGGFTISYFLFALVFVAWGGGKYSTDYLLFKKYRDKLSGPAR